MRAEKTIADQFARGGPHSLCLRSGSRAYASYAFVGGRSLGKDDDAGAEETASL